LEENTPHEKRNCKPNEEVFFLKCLEIQHNMQLQIQKPSSSKNFHKHSMSRTKGQHQIEGCFFYRIFGTPPLRNGNPKSKASPLFKLSEKHLLTKNRNPDSTKTEKHFLFNKNLNF
jgi:hypothetical protein